jgi:hypothetical protein
MSPSIGRLIIGVTALVTTFVMGQRASTDLVQDQKAKVEACNKYADDQVTGKTTEVSPDAGIGAVVSVAGGAIADGGKGTGKSAALGGVVGASGGSVYDLNENKAHDGKYKAAYASCGF